MDESASFRTLPDRRFDLLIIGGGIIGCAIARDAALRGIRTALFEREDLGSGTSSRTSRLIHGGLRYLEQGAVRLVREASRERAIWLRIAPHLVRPLPFLLPIYHDRPRNAAAIRAGLWLYDLLAGFQNTAPYRMLATRELLRLEPTIDSRGLRGGAIFWDATMNDARLCLEVGLDAAERGAELYPHVEVVGAVRQAGRVVGLRLRDTEGGQESAALGTVIVNAAGPWVDRVPEISPPAAGRVRLTRGSHLLVPRLTQNHALLLASRRDGRIFFVIPSGDLSLVGTTDVDHHGMPGPVGCPEEDLGYLLEETGAALGGGPPDLKQVVASFAGLRPLRGRRGPASAVGRDWIAVEDPAGVLTVVGGKFTVARSIAERVVDRVQARLGHPGWVPSRTATVALPGAVPDPDAYRRHEIPEAARESGLLPEEIDRLISTYGGRYRKVLEVGGDRRDARERIGGLPLLGAEIAWMVRVERARTLSDLLRRRTQIALGPRQSDENAVRAVARAMATERGWSTDQVEQQIRGYRRQLAAEWSAPQR